MTKEIFFFNFELDDVVMTEVKNAYLGRKC